MGTQPGAITINPLGDLSRHSQALTDGVRDNRPADRRGLTEPSQLNVGIVVVGALWDGILGTYRSCPRQLLLCLTWSECLNVLVNKLGGEYSLALQRLPVVVSAVEGIKLCTAICK